MLDRDKNLQEDFEESEDMNDQSKGGQSEAEATDEVLPTDDYAEESEQR